MLRAHLLKECLIKHFNITRKLLNLYKYVLAKVKKCHLTGRILTIPFPWSCTKEYLSRLYETNSECRVDCLFKETLSGLLTQHVASTPLFKEMRRNATVTNTRYLIRQVFCLCSCGPKETSEAASSDTDGCDGWMTTDKGRNAALTSLSMFMKRDPKRQGLCRWHWRELTVIWEVR